MILLDFFVQRKAVNTDIEMLKKLKNRFRRLFVHPKKRKHFLKENATEHTTQRTID